MKNALGVMMLVALMALASCGGAEEAVETLESDVNTVEVTVEADADTLEAMEDEVMEEDAMEDEAMEDEAMEDEAMEDEAMEEDAMEEDAMEDEAMIEVEAETTVQ